MKLIEVKMRQEGKPNVDFVLLNPQQLGWIEKTDDGEALVEYGWARLLILAPKYEDFVASVRGA